jgi:hypothetical protein
MPSTTVHLPEQLLSKIDQLVKEKGISRNRFIIQACEKAVNDSAGQWPEAFFESKLSQEDLDLLRESVLEMESEILQRRRSRRSATL